MLLHVREVLNADELRAGAPAPRRRAVGRRPGRRPACSRRRPRTTSSCPRTAPATRALQRSCWRRSSAHPAVLLGRAAEAGLSAALQPLRRRRQRVRQPRRQRRALRSRRPGRPRAHRHQLHAVPGRPDDYDGGELVVEDTFGAQSRQAAGRRHGALSRHQRAPGRAGDARRARWRASSGSRAWCAATSSGACCTTWTCT